MTVPTPLAGVQSLTVQTHRLAVHGLLVGDEGVPVVCLHGHLATSTYFEELMLGLPEGLRGVAIDLRGHGGTEPWPIDARAGCDDLVADVHAFVRAQGIGPHHLLAHGVGAAIMWRYLLHYSQDVLSVTAVNPAPPCGYGGSRDESGARIAKDGVPAGAGAVDLEFVRRLAEEDRTESSSSSPAVRLARHLGRAVPRQGALLDAMLGIIVDDGLYPGDVEPSDTWPFHRPGQRGLLNAVCSRWYDASGVVKMEHKPPLLWLRGEQDPVISDAGEEDLAVVAAAGGDRGWPGPELCPPQPMIAQMAYFLDAYSQAGGQTASHVLPGAHLPWLSHPDAFARIWHTWIMGSGR